MGKNPEISEQHLTNHPWLANQVADAMKKESLQALQDCWVLEGIFNSFEATSNL